MIRQMSQHLPRRKGPFNNNVNFYEQKLATIKGYIH